MANITTCLRCTGLYEESSEERANAPDRRCPACYASGSGRITLMVCGPSKCEHDYNRFEDVVKDGRVVGGTAVCSKCGVAAIDDAMWE